MTDAQIADLVKRTAQETAQQVLAQTFLTLGIDVDEPLTFQADMQHLRAWRESIATVKRQGLGAAFVAIVMGIMGMIWMSIKNGP